MAGKGVDIAWQNFSVVRPLSKSEKKIRSKSGLSVEPIPVINQISGVIEKGTMTTILGPSGCGKTTFLNFLSNRLHFLAGLEFSGDVFINGYHRKKLDFNSVAGYVMQEEVLLENLTVKETLNFSASFKMSKHQARKRVQDIIEQLGLKACEDSFVGGFVRKGISGGEKKRVSIGVELLTDPSVLFLDEPTTGLDSFNAESLVELLGQLSKTGVTVIATIHQPNSYIFALFDQIMLLGANEVIYHGSAENSLNHFGTLGLTCPEFYNPSEYLLELITESHENYPKNIEKLKKAIVKNDLLIEEKELPELFKREHSGFFNSLRLLVSRSSTNILRGYISILIKAVANIFFLLLILAAYYQACDDDTLVSVSDRAGIIFIILVFMSFISVNSTTTLSTDKAIFMREQSSKLYSPGAFYMSKLVFDIPFDQIILIIMGFLLYLAIGLRLDTADHIFFFVFVLYLLDLTSRGWGNFILIAMPNIEAASSATPFVVILQLLFAGLFINYENIPNYLIWLEYMSMFKYSWSACMYNELEGHDDDYWQECDGNNTGSKKINLDMCDPLDFYSITIPKWHNILALSCIAIITHSLAFLFLNLIAKKYRVN
jgi:ABC-type multidrug transport system ATPase subunit